MKQLEFKIWGQTYLLGCPDGADDRLLGAVKTVDVAMQKIQDSGMVRARDRIAVLAAVNLVFDLSVPRSSDYVVPITLPEEASTKLSAVLARLDQALNGEDAVPTDVT